MSSDSSRQSDIDVVFIERDDVSNYNPEQILPESLESIQEIRKWLQPTSYDNESGEYHKHLASHFAGTGAWVTSSAIYQEWVQSEERGMLWIKGIPGSGKSVLASKLIQELSQSQPGVPVLYFFFRQIIDANHKPVALLRDWLDQVLFYSPPLQKQLKGYIKSERSISSMSMEDLWRDLRMAFSGLRDKVYCIADALDEMDQGNDSFLEALATLGQWKPHKVKVLITSRPVPSIESPLRTAKFIQIRLEEKLVDMDISSYVQHSLKTSSIAPENQELITKAVPGHANGLFLYAKLAMDSFLEPGANIKEVLYKLPTDLNSMYTSLLHDHAFRSNVPDDIQLLILQWITHATRPLRLLELAEMIKVTYREESCQDLKATKDLVRAACGPLLEVLPDETVCVVHHSFTEYLTGSTRPRDPVGYPILRPGPTHARLALACLTYMQAGGLEDVEVKERSTTVAFLHNEQNYTTNFGPVPVRLRLKYPFLEYAVNNWDIHIARSTAAEYDQTNVNIALDMFLQNSQYMKIWLIFRWPNGERAISGVTKLHIAAKSGLTLYVQEILASGTLDVDAVDLYGKSSLWWAAASGQAEIICLLIEAGADPDKAENRYGLKPLHEAAGKNHFKAVEALLEAGVDPLTMKTKVYHDGPWMNVQISNDSTALMDACNNGHLETVVVFLRFLNDVDVFHRALAWAAENGHSLVVERILQCSGVNVNAKVQEVTPLFIACMNGDFNTIKLLLNAGADPTILCEKITRRFMDNKMKMKIHSSGKINDSSDRGMTALHQLCLWNLKRMEPEELLTVFSLLIRAGANIHQCTPEGFQPLHYAVRNPVLVRLLLDAGADANVTADDGTTALHKCSSLDSISLLIENGGANINKQIQTNGWTPLHNMVLVMDGENLVKFIEYGPDCNIADKYGNGALHTVLSRSIPFRPGPKPALISALLKAGADPALKNYSGETPLHVMLFDSQYSTEIMSLLLEAGADINAKDNNGYTLLYRTFQDPRSESRINSPAGPVLLLNHGASANVRDLRGRTILHETIKYPDYLSGDFTRSNPNATQLDFYLDLGLDLHAVDYHGNNLLHELAFRQNKYTINGFRSLLEKLVSLGLDPNKENYGGQTPLHIVAGDRRRLLILPSADGMPIDLVISVTKNINAIDNHGITPLHLAAAVSAYNVTKLLEAGADPTCSTHKGITPLHLAAWSRQSNIVGVLLEALHLKSHTSDVKSNISVDAYELPTPPRIWSHKRWSQPPIGIDVLDHRGLTPLAYACRSGRPETVALLLQAGADVNIEATIKACVQFDNEQELWCKSDKCFDAATEGINDLVNFILKDKSRPSIEASGASGPSNNMQPNTDTARLEEILDMLLENGTDMSHFGHNWWKLLRAESVSNGTGRYTLGLLLKARKLLLEDVQIGNNTSIPNMFAEHALRYHQLATDQALREFKHIRQGEANQDLVHSMLIQREYDMIEKLFHLGVDFLVADQLNGNSNLGIFVQHGFASLVEKIGNLEVAAKFKAGICHAAGDKTRPGLGFFTEGNSEYTTSKNGLPAPYLLQAVSRELPNMDVIHLLVEKFGVDVDELDCEWGNASRVYKKASLGSALIILAEGCFWWQVALAMPYLIDYSADLEIRNKMGQTPLHIALTETNAGPFHKEAARILIAAGADVNAVDINCCSCLAYAKNDIEMMRLLIANGARVNPDALFAAIDSKRVDVLELLLSAGADANMRRQRRKESLPNKKLTNGLEICASPNLQISLIAEDQWFPVHYAARQIRPDDDLFITTLDTRESIVHIVETLLSHGADPFAKFMKRLTHEWPNGDYLSVDQANDDEHTNGKSIQSAVSGMEMTEQSCNECDPGQMSAEYEECTVLHELLLEGNIVEPFLKLPHLDPNLHNAKGQTLFHAACRGRLGPDAPVNSVIGLQRDTNEISTSSLFSCLLSGGADIAACDNAGRNALHHMLWPIEQRYSRRAFIVSLKRLIELCPMLVNQQDSAGRTPLHMAVVYAVEYGNTRGAEALLDVAANPFVTDQNGDTILHILLRSLHNADLFKLLRKLLACGLNLNARNILGETPLFTFYGRKHVNKLDNAEREWSGEALTILETGHPNFVARDNRGRGLLHVAAKGDVRRFQELMGKGLDPMLEDNDGRTALDIAAACGNIEITRLFERENVE